MPKALNADQKTTVTNMLASKAPQRDIAQAASCSVSQIKRMAKNIRRWGRPVAPKLVPQGRPRALTPDVAEGLIEYFRQNPFANLGDMVAYAFETYHIATTKSTVSRLLKRANIDRNELQVIAKSRMDGVPTTLETNDSIPLDPVITEPDSKARCRLMEGD